MPDYLIYIYASRADKPNGILQSVLCGIRLCKAELP